MKPYTLCIIKPNNITYSETFIQAHIDRLSGVKNVLYGGSFPVYKQDGSYLISSKWGLFSYLIQKRIFKKKNIKVRTRALVDYFKAEKVDVVLAEYGTVGAMVAESCRLANVPLVIHFHGTDAHHKSTLAEYKEEYQRAFDYASAIVGVSGDMIANLHKHGAALNKLILNPYGVNTDLFKPIDISNSQPYFLSVGRFVAKKSPSSTVNAFKQVVDRFPKAHLWMVGDGPLLEETKQLTISLGLEQHITFTGVQTTAQILERMKQVRCFVQHSVTAADGDMEGTPNTILEASASGLPVVSTRHAGIKEAVVEGVTGFLVDEFDVQGMADRMLDIAASAELAQRLGTAARAHIIQHYKIEDRIAKLDHIIEDCIR